MMDVPDIQYEKDASGEQHVASSDELVGTALVEDGLGIDGGDDAEGDTGREVGLDGAGDDVDRRTLRGDDEVDADGTCPCLQSLGDDFHHLQGR